MSGVTRVESGDKVPAAPIKESSQQTKAFDARQVLAVKYWQDWVFFGATFVTLCLVAKRALSGNVSESLMFAGVSGTLIMGQAYTKDALGKYQLALIAQTLEGQVVNLANQVDIFRDQLEENRRLAADYKDQNEYHRMTNLEQHNMNMEMYRQLEDHRRDVALQKQEIELRRQDLERLLAEIEEGNQQKTALTRELNDTTKELSRVRGQLTEVSQRLYDQTDGAQGCRALEKRAGGIFGDVLPITVF